jgi:hypothetical protein
MINYHVCRVFWHYTQRLAVCVVAVCVGAGMCFCKVLINGDKSGIKVYYLGNCKNHDSSSVGRQPTEKLEFIEKLSGLTKAITYTDLLALVLISVLFYGFDYLIY